MISFLNFKLVVRLYLHRIRGVFCLHKLLVYSWKFPIIILETLSVSWSTKIFRLPGKMDGFLRRARVVDLLFWSVSVDVGSSTTFLSLSSSEMTNPDVDVCLLNFTGPSLWQKYSSFLYQYYHSLMVPLLYFCSSSPTTRRVFWLSGESEGLRFSSLMILYAFPVMCECGCTRPNPKPLPAKEGSGVLLFLSFSMMISWCFCGDII